MEEPDGNRSNGVDESLNAPFGLGRIKRRDERCWILPVALNADSSALIGGISLAYRQIDQQQPAKTTALLSPATRQGNSHIQNTATGHENPIVQGIQSIYS